MYQLRAGSKLGVVTVMKKPRKQSDEPHRWGVHMLRKRGVRLGTVEAKDIEEALEKAYEQFDRWRVTVQRE
jgi:hypothetical protein